MKPAVSDPPEIQYFLWHGWEGNVGWDVGANCGQTIPRMKQRFFTVIAFEPALECRPYLDAFEDIVISPLALSDNDETVELLALPDKIDTGQLVTAGTVGMEWDPTDPRAVTRTLHCRRVDTLIDTGTPAPDFMKIDVEGHELKVLTGATRTLALKRPDLLIEFHSKDLHRSCVDMLEGFGYKTHTVRHPHYRPGTDLWFTHGWIKATAH